jgi:hypothetical protein
MLADAQVRGGFGLRRWLRSMLLDRERRGVTRKRKRLIDAVTLFALLVGYLALTLVYLLVKRSADALEARMLLGGLVTGNQLVDLLYWSMSGVLLCDLGIVNRNYRQADYALSTGRLLLNALVGIGLAVGLGLLGILLGHYLAPRVRMLTIEASKPLAVVIMLGAFTAGYYKDVWFAGVMVLKEEHDWNLLAIIKRIPKSLFATADRN